MDRRSLFANRKEAGQRLAHVLVPFARERPVVIALPRGGVPVGYEVAHALHAPLTVLVVRKVGAPWNPELGIAAVTEKGLVAYDMTALKQLNLSPKHFAGAIAREQAEVLRRVQCYRGSARFPHIKNTTVILVDDGVARGMTATAAIAFLRRLHPKTIVFAAPVAAAESAEHLSKLVEHVVFLKTPVDLATIGLWYRDFSQVSDEEVEQLLRRYNGLAAK